MVPKAVHHVALLGGDVRQHADVVQLGVGGEMVGAANLRTRGDVVDGVAGGVIEALTGKFPREDAERVVGLRVRVSAGGSRELEGERRVLPNGDAVRVGDAPGLPVLIPHYCEENDYQSMLLFAGHLRW